MKFDELNLHPSLLASLKALQYDNCTPVQEQVLPVAINGTDISALAQTGTGKTAAFLVPVIERLLRTQQLSQAGAELSEEERALAEKRAFKDWQKRCFAFILVPTRELAEQVKEQAEKIGGPCGFRAVAVYGGSSYEPQKNMIEQGVEFIIGTPGRLIDLYKSHVLDLKQVRAMVFDEADRMFDMGFKEDMKYLLQRVPRERQFFLLSATLNFDVLHTAYAFGAEPVEFNISRDQAKAENVKDYMYHLGSDEKPRYLLSLLRTRNPQQTIIFSNFKHHVERIARFLNDNDVPAMAISSLLTQNQRNRVIEQFRNNTEKNFLVATDVAARGLDIKGVDLVINYDLPEDAENYVHRIGRTGRASNAGVAISLVSERDVESLMRVEEYLKHKIEVCWFEDSELVAEFKPLVAEERAFRKTQPTHSGGGYSQNRRPRPPRRGDRGGPERGDRPARGDRPERASRPGAARHEGQPGRPQERARGEGQEEHRDRKMGRHRDRNASPATSNGQGPSKDGAPNARPGRPNPNAKHAHDKRVPRQQGNGQGGYKKSNGPRGKKFQRSSPIPVQKSSGVIQKVTGLFKRLLGAK